MNSLSPKRPEITNLQMIMNKTHIREGKSTYLQVSFEH